MTSSSEKNCFCLARFLWHEVCRAGIDHHQKPGEGVEARPDSASWKQDPRALQVPIHSFIRRLKDLGSARCSRGAIALKRRCHGQ